MRIEYLKWDSDFFSKKIGKIQYKTPDNEKLVELLENAQKESYNLLYLFSSEDQYIDESILNNFSGKLIDRKVLYSQELSDKEKATNLQHDTLYQIEEYPETILTHEIESLAYLSGKYSRFNVDDKFDVDDFQRLYKTWIVKSITKDIADKVYIVKEENAIKGIVTLKYNKDNGEVGLIAIDESVQGKGYGKGLITACKKDLISQNITRLEVPTQFANFSACKFYERCGFQIKSITNIYHFWL